MRKLSKLKAIILFCIVAVMIVMGMSYTTKADTLSGGTDEEKVVELNLNYGFIRIYPTKYVQGGDEVAHVGKYIITGSHGELTALQIINDSNEEVTFDITLRNVNITSGSYTTATRIEAYGDTIINLHNEGNSYITTNKNHPPIKLHAGTGNVTVNVDIISGSLTLKLLNKDTVSGGYIYSEGITFNCKVPFCNTIDSKVVLKHESNNGTYILDEENNVHMQKCIYCGNDIIGQHNIASVTSVDETYHKGKCNICLYDIKTKHNYGELRYNDGIYSNTCITNGCAEKRTLKFNLPNEGTEYTYGDFDNTIKAAIDNPSNIPYDEIKYKWYEVIEKDGVDTYELIEGATDDRIVLPYNTSVGEYRYKVETEVDGVVGSYETSVKVVPRIIEVKWDEVKFIYNGEEQCPTATITNLVLCDECNMTITGGQVNVGTGYIAKVVAIDNDNYCLPEGGISTTFDIVNKVVIRPADDNEDGKLSNDNKDYKISTDNSSDEKANKAVDMAEKVIDKTPDTSDEQILLQWLCLMMVSVCGMMILKRYKRI